jgi:hypothetical protein
MNRKTFLIPFFLTLCMCICSLSKIDAQRGQIPDSLKAIQLSGMVVTEENGQVIPLPYVNIYVEGTTRGTYSSNEGFFSLVVRKGEKVIFSTMGFKSIEYVVPDSLNRTRYTLYQILSQDNILLPETVVYPWPSRENFNAEFLAMDVSDVLEENAMENLSEKALAQLREYLPSDGAENVGLYLRQQADSYVYAGQIKPIKVLDVFAWQKFIQAWKRGDFKKKKK